MLNVKILFSGYGLPGHILPMLPLLRAFRDRGDDVAVLSTLSAAPMLDDHGAARVRPIAHTAVADRASVAAQRR
jgi:UDP:flavonoid glycosyltransferase YjiC (YdhE family)